MPCSKPEQTALGLIRVALACALGFWLGSVLEWADLSGASFVFALAISVVVAFCADFGLHVVFDKMIEKK